MARDPLPILLCTYWHETIFSNRAVIELYQQLTQPKRLVVQIGDHGTGESTGLAGLGSRPTNAMVMWFNHHLKGEGELDGHEVVVETMHHVFGEAKKYPSWQEFVRSPRRYHRPTRRPRRQHGRRPDALRPMGIQLRRGRSHRG